MEKKHSDADYLSRHALEFGELEQEADVVVPPGDVNLIFSSASRAEVNLNHLQVRVPQLEEEPNVQQIPAKELAVAQEEDPVIAPVMKLMVLGNIDRVEMKKLGKGA